MTFAEQQLFESCQRVAHYFAALYSVFLGPFNKLLCGGTQLTPSEYKRKQRHWKRLKPEKQVCLWAPCEILTFVSLKFSVLQGTLQWIHLTQKNCISWSRGGVPLSKAASLHRTKALNHVRMLAVLLAQAVCVLHWRVGSDPGCVTSVAQNCHSSCVLLQATLHLHANASH